MAKMNGDRVRNWDRVRDGRSDMELADARDEQWLQRERAREDARGERQDVGQGVHGEVQVRRRPREVRFA